MAMRVIFHIDAHGAGRVELFIGGDGIDPADPNHQVRVNPGLDEAKARAWAETIGRGVELVRYERAPQKNGGMYETIVVKVPDFDHFSLPQPQLSDEPSPHLVPKVAERPWRTLGVPGAAAPTDVCARPWYPSDASGREHALRR